MSPRYLNSPETALYTKGDLLFGLHEAREQLVRGAMPVIVEGPFDAIAVSVAGAGSYVGLAPCGTALTVRQLTALAGVADLDRTGLLVALDGDRAGHDGEDPAGILQTDGPAASCDALRRTEPLAQVVIDAHLDRWDRQLDHAEGQLAAMRSAATLIARMLPADAVDAMRRMTGGREFAILDADTDPILDPVLPTIARALPVGVACQIVRAAHRTGCDCCEVTAEVVRAARQEAKIPQGEVGGCATDM